jgi:hypothetical protein
MCTSLRVEVNRTLYFQNGEDGFGGLDNSSGPAESFGTVGITITVPDNGKTTVYANSTDAAGNVSLCSVAFITYAEKSQKSGEVRTPISLQRTKSREHSGKKTLKLVGVLTYRLTWAPDSAGSLILL